MDITGIFPSFSFNIDWSRSNLIEEIPCSRRCCETSQRILQKLHVFKLVSRSAQVSSMLNPGSQKSNCWHRPHRLVDEALWGNRPSIPTALTSSVANLLSTGKSVMSICACLRVRNGCPIGRSNVQWLTACPVNISKLYAIVRVGLTRGTYVLKKKPKKKAID